MIDIESINSISYRDKKILVSRACLMYRKIKSSKNLIEVKLKHANILNDIEKSSTMLNLKTMSIFDTILNLLERDLHLIISEDFIDINPDSKWYLKHWSKTTYYKLKHEAVNQFLFMLFA